MKWLRVRPYMCVNHDGTAGVGRYEHGQWFFVIGEQCFEGYATRDDAIDAAEQHLAALETQVVPA